MTSRNHPAGYPPRSLLYVPGSNARALEKAGGLAADMLIIDLEDAVPADRKAEARDAIYRRLWSVLSVGVKDERYVRVSPGDRAAIVEILGATKSGLPDYFRAP